MEPKLTSMKDYKNNQFRPNGSRGWASKRAFRVDRPIQGIGVCSFFYCIRVASWRRHREDTILVT